MKLTSLLKALKADEHKEFEKFLQSPFFRANEQYLAYFRCLCKRHPDFEVGRTELEASYRACFEKQVLTESKLYNLMSGLSGHLEMYLSVKQVLTQNGNGNNALQKELFAKSLGERNMGAFFRMEAERQIQEKESLLTKTLQDYHTLEQLHQLVYFNPDTPKYSPNSDSLPQALHYLDLHYCIAKLRYVAEMKMRERLFQVRYDLPMLQAVLAMTSAPELMQSHPLAGIYNRLVNLQMQDFDEAGFRNLSAFFIENRHLLPRDDQQFVLRHLINYGIALASDLIEVQREMLQLYKLAIEADMLLVSNRITIGAFVNIVALATKCKEFDWAWDFIHQFSPYLEENRRKAAVDLASANIHYSLGNLDEAQSNLTVDVFMVAGFDIVARGLLLKIAFDRYVLFGKDYDFLLSHIKAFEKYVNAKQLTQEKKNAQLNCLKFVRKMVVTKFMNIKVTKVEKESLRTKLAVTQPIALKDWLSERIEQL